MRWQTIDSAPKDKEVRILLYTERVLGSVRTGHWHPDSRVGYCGDGWWLDGFDHQFNQEPFMPTHWMPLPDKPTTG